jgi:citrate lyase subunit alpha/citrate CoA-transferase
MDLRIAKLAADVIEHSGIPAPLEYTDKIVGIVEYRDGTIIDVIHQLKEK